MQDRPRLAEMGVAGRPVLTTALAAAAAAGAAALAHGAFEPNSPVFGPAIGRGPREAALYLTFDDGPNPRTTDRIVRILEQERVPATFFMLGRYVERYPELARSVALRGFGIGNHTHTHTKLTLLGPARTAEEVARAHQAIETHTGIIRRRMRARLRPGAVLLLHDGDGYDPEGDRSQTAEALPGIIEDCRTMGFEFGSLDRLVAA